MKVDLRDLECPEPIIKVRDALNSMKIGENLEAVVNSLPPSENITRFLTTNEIIYETVQNGQEITFKITKNKELKDQDTSLYSCTLPTQNFKVIYLNEDRAGSGEVGASLLSKFLGTIPKLSNKPFKIICINNGVYLTTNRAHPCYEVLKNLESMGVEILTCGSCLEAYGLVDKLGIGRMTNAYEVMENLTKYEVITL
ncbi:MAG: sulfurtransferase-like selenium metabolism protein YedF [Campylobacter sp.]|nr:sulfurtransferase-like selenium metabolism protein YedF [Campylobacter sp.]